MTTLVACVGLYGERVDQAIVNIKRLRPGVDRYVCIIDETVTEEQKQQLIDLECEVYLEKWQDSMVKMRNAYLNKAQTDDWIIVHDPDEVFNELFCQDIRQLIDRAIKQKIDLLLVNSHDTTILEDDSTESSVSDFYKNLVFRKIGGTRYEGVGEVKEVHETLVLPGITRAVRLPKAKYWYEHTKYWHEVWERAGRNVFIAGGGNNSGEKNPSWRPLRDICDSLGLDNWTKAREYFREGNIDPRLREWFWENRFEGFDFDHEEQEFGRWYFEYLHPEETSWTIIGYKPDPKTGIDKGTKELRTWKPMFERKQGSRSEIMEFVEEQYLAILGRNADQAGKEAYTNAIYNKQLNREDLQLLLKQSPEYKQQVTPRMPLEGGEGIRLQVPVNVDIQVSEELFIRALMRSKTYWETIKPKLDIGTFLEVALGDDWIRLQEWFYDTERSLNEFTEKLREIINA